MSDSVRPHGWQPTKLPRPWDSPGKNTGVGCHFLLQCMKVKVKLLSRVQLLATPWTVAYQAPPSMGFSRQEYWSGCHCLLRTKDKGIIQKELLTQIDNRISPSPCRYGLLLGRLEYEKIRLHQRDGFWGFQKKRKDVRIFLYTLAS